jgi:hypothetical protein
VLETENRKSLREEDYCLEGKMMRHGGLYNQVRLVINLNSNASSKQPLTENPLASP